MSSQVPSVMKFSRRSSSISAAIPATSPARCRSRQQVGHVLPVELLEDERVVGRRPVERHLHARPLPPRGALVPGVADHQERRHDDLEVLDPASRAGGTVLHIGQQGLAEVGRRVQRVHVDTVRHLAGHAEHPRADGGDVDRRVCTVDRSRCPHGRQQRQVVELAFDGQRRTAAEGLEDLLHGEDVLAQARSRVLERRAVAALDVGAHLRSQPQAETASARLRQLPRRGGSHHGAAWERHRDPRQHVDLGRRGDGAAGEVRRASRLRDDQAGQPGGRGSSPDLRRPAQRLRRQHGVELQRHGTRTTITSPDSFTAPAPPAPRGCSRPSRGRSATSSHGVRSTSYERGRLGTLVQMVRLGRHEPPVDEPDLGHEVGVGAGAGGGGAEAEDALGPHDRVGHGPSRQEGPVVVALELAGVGVEDVQRPLQDRLRRSRSRRSAPAGRPTRPTSTSAASGAGPPRRVGRPGRRPRGRDGRRAARATPRWRRRAPRRCPGARSATRRVARCQVPVEVEVERRVQEDRARSRPGPPPPPPRPVVVPTGPKTPDWRRR